MSAVPAVAPPIVVEGQRALAEQAPDGTWTIRGVPLFAAHVGVSAATGKRVTVDRAWLTKAVDRAQTGYSNAKYLPTLHVNHHDWGDPVEDAGFFLPTHVAPARTAKGVVLAIYGDLVGVRPEIYERIRTRRLPYLSPEANLDEPELATCALLPTRPPRGKFSPLTIGAERALPKKLLRAAPQVAAYASDTGVGASRILTRIPRTMDPKPLDGSAPKTEKNAEPGATPPAPAAVPAAAPDIGAKIDALATAIASLSAMVAKLVEPDDDDTPGEPAPAVGTPSTAYAEKLGAVEGKVTALETKLSEREKADTRAAEIGDVRKRLSRYGSRIAKLDEKLEQLYATGGKPALTCFAESIEKSLPAGEPTTTLDGASGAEGGVGTELPAELLTKYGSRGPDDLAEVARLSREFDRLGGDRGVGCTRLDYVEVELRVASIHKPAAV